MGLAPTPHELMQNRADARALLTDNVAIYRASNASDGRGGQTTTHALLNEGPGRLAAMRGAEVEFYAERLGLSQGFMVSIEPGRAVTPGDQLRIRGRRFEVLASDYGATDSWLQRVPCREIG